VVVRRGQPGRPWASAAPPLLLLHAEALGASDGGQIWRVCVVATALVVRTCGGRVRWLQR
jgi:hypothetical protein